GIRKYGPKNVEYIENKNEVNKRLHSIIKSGDVLMTLGAGDVWKLGRDFLITQTPRKTNY
ncbi:uncharacterized protein METZ01_LOCUS299960, partial [marine metagenome]